jgi:hypothetical protein
MRTRHVILSGFAGLLVLLAIVALSRAGGDPKEVNKGVYPLTEKVGGKTYAEWTAAWWQWGMGATKEKNPILDKTGEFAEKGQAGPVWFLAGNFGGEVTRKCSVPVGKAIFFPVLNQGPGGSFDNPDEDSWRKLAKESMDTAYDLEVIVDGKALEDVKNYRVAAPLFTFTGPEKEDDSAFPGMAGKHKMVSDGFWIMLKPLAKGEHVVRFKGKVKASEFSLDVTYKLTLVEDK